MGKGMRRTPLEQGRLLPKAGHERPIEHGCIVQYRARRYGLTQQQCTADIGGVQWS